MRRPPESLVWFESPSKLAQIDRTAEILSKERFTEARDNVDHPSGVLEVLIQRVGVRAAVESTSKGTLASTETRLVKAGRHRQNHEPPPYRRVNEIKKGIESKCPVYVDYLPFEQHLKTT